MLAAVLPECRDIAVEALMMAAQQRLLGDRAAAPGCCGGLVWCCGYRASRSLGGGWRSWWTSIVAAVLVTVRMTTSTMAVAENPIGGPI
jgi:hypothetical protein